MNPQPWLPLSSLVGDAIFAPLAGAIEGWCQAWFRPLPPLSLSVVQRGRPVWTAASGEYRWEVHRAAVALAAGPNATGRLRALALDADPQQRPATARDRLVLDDFGRRLMADLAARIEGAFAIPGALRDAPERLEDPWSGGDTLAALCAFADGTEAIRIGLPAAALVPYRRRSAAPSRGKRGLATLAHALAPVRVPLQARIGTAILSVDELRGIAPGDVLLLDRAIDDPAEILVNFLPSGRARLHDAAGRACLTFVAETP
ncbi:MAG TPA: FliM/FliN family flagellar motor switch protein [Allosphingosinicella sp.]|nr:FliM/FliN family flagellar motor switch protein [Allosphingosinicella sp.]